MGSKGKESHSRVGAKPASVMNELMAEFWNKELPSKKKDYVKYSDMEWEDLAQEKNLSDKMLKNIIIEVE